MSAEWLSNTGGVPGRVNGVLQEVLHRLAQPGNARRLRQGLLLLLALWGVLALSSLIWALLPAGDVAPPETARVINPVISQGPGVEAATVDIQRMLDWHLFGKAGAAAVPENAVAEVPAAKQPGALDGIEKGARETRLELVLRGVVASSEDGRGHAIIEYRKKQDVYAVEDKLPLGGTVLLAKVMPQQVVLDNNGKYELLTLFDDSHSDAGLAAAAPRAPAANSGQRKSPQLVDKSQDRGATTLAMSYRERLYKNPQSLAQVVSVSAVRQEGQLLGYRISPGKDKEQFSQLGFKTGDLVTGVNGIALDDPANTMKLYQAMRSADAAVFDLQRDNQPLTINVSLDDSAQR